MNTNIPYLVVPAIAVAAATLFAVQPNGAASAPTRRLVDDPALVERGRYLVHGAVLCIDCHSPRNEKGELLEGRLLTGSPLAFGPVVPMPFAKIAPRIAGLPAGYTEEEMVHFLMTGERPHGMPAPLPPMPPYRLNRADAESVAAYLHSLPANPGE